MGKKINILSTCCLLSSFLLCGASFGQQNFENVEIKSYRVQGQVWVLSGAGGNVTVQIGDEGVLVVDTQYEAMSEKILAEIKRLAGPDKFIRFILNTHSHGDHTGGNFAISQGGATIVAGNFARDVAADKGAQVIAHENSMLRMAGALGGEAVDFDLWPSEVYLGERYDIYFNDEGVSLLFQPNAHTDGDSMVMFRRSDVLSTGDVYVTTGFPFIDVDSGGHINGIIDALNNILDIAIPEAQQEGGTLIIPGHGRISDEADVLEYRDMITIIRDRVQMLIDDGNSLSQVLAAEPALDYSGRYGEGFVSTESFIEAIYNGLNK
jgi:cyclase